MELVGFNNFGTGYWQCGDRTVFFEPDHNYMDKPGPPFDMPAVMRSMSDTVFSIEKGDQSNEVGMYVIVDY